MSRGLSGFIKGVGTGMVAGMAVAATGSMLMKSNKGIKKNAGKAIKAVGDFVENVQFMMK
ncbi:MAG: hypothetical protein BGN88_06495 [Clostridiales bacterium 43-6]|nr:MAG: hypothetical protein BGN88_06495 [Clostridiales bacterium 43-6]